MAIQDQVEQLAWLLDNQAAVEAGKQIVAFADERTRSAIGKLAGCTAEQVGAWARGSWSPATGQRLALMRAVAEHGSQYSGRVVAS